MLRILQSPWYPGDSAFEPADPQAGVVVEDPGEQVLCELLAEAVDVDHHADDDAVELTGRLRWRLADVMADRKPGGFDLVPHRLHCGAAVIDDVAVIVLARVEWQQEGLEPQRLQFGKCLFSACGIPPVDQSRAVEVAA